MAEKTTLEKLNDLIDENEGEFAKAMGAKRNFGTWMSVAKMWVAKTSTTMKYADCGRNDIINAYLTAAKLGLLIDGVEGMVNVRGKRCQFEVGYRGIVRLAGQSGIVINARTIRQGDKIDIDEGMGVVHHTPGWLIGGESGEAIGFYAIALHKDGRKIVRSMSMAQVRKRSRDTDTWRAWGDEMGEKTVIKSLEKVLSFGDAVDDLLASANVHSGEYEEEEPEPQHPPQTTRDKVLAAAARAEQDAAAEGPQCGDGSDPI